MLHRKRTLNQAPPEQPDRTPGESPYPDDLFTDARFPKKKTPGERMRETIRKQKAAGLGWGRGRVFDYDEIRRLWLEGRSLAEIMAVIGCKKETVMKAVGEIGQAGEKEQT